ncbi:salicylate synthase [Actinokineospora sp. UTMC 2448]|uniref:salicylate synthase n=1 Tax=Actinokineospora sp. UTMC 2448 TaxID=2268449 RepID=UPI002164834D|nr:salicylate synthase [Actinokineospora sp. UTMC 2448]UVS79532.1 Isochorismate synthase/isochorismate-pyruvate lyase MbtI [Actinokineospora sp. UTMC 2448]
MTTTSPCYHETTVPVTADPLDVVVRLAEAGPDDDYVVYEKDGAFTYAGGVLAEVTVDRHGGRLGDTALPWNGRPLELVRALLATLPMPGWRAYGWAAFELAYASDRDRLGDQRLAHLMVPRGEVRVADGRARIRAVDPTQVAVLADVVAASRPLAVPCPRPVNVRAVDGHRYRAAVADVLGDIRANLVQKAILSRVVELGAVDLAATYALGRRANTPARSFLLRMDGVEAAGFSPEVVVSVAADGEVVSQPLAGTRPLTGDENLNEHYRTELLSDVKEIHEHAISVKLCHDELLAVCAPRSVHLRDLMTVKRRGTVQHLASHVGGLLAPGRDAWDAFAAVFPAVTASGVPKEAAYAAIRRHEPEPRGLYAGAVMTVDASGELDAALVLRSIHRHHGRTWLRAGAGIVAQSTPDREFAETCAKLDSVARFLVPAPSEHEHPTDGNPPQPACLHDH